MSYHILSIQISGNLNFIHKATAKLSNCYWDGAFLFAGQGKLMEMGVRRTDNISQKTAYPNQPTNTREYHVCVVIRVKTEIYKYDPTPRSKV